MKKVLTIFVLSILFILLTGCGTKQEIEVEKAKAEAIVKEYFEAMMNEDIDKALDFYSDIFFSKTPKDESRTFLTNHLDRLGAPESMELVKWNGKKNTKGPDPGIRWIFQYKVTYENQPAFEKITIFRPLDGDYKIFHTISMPHRKDPGSKGPSPQSYAAAGPGLAPPLRIDLRD